MSCTAVADTGATVTCGGPDILAALGVRRTDLMPSNIQLFAANKSRLEVLGVLPVSLALTADSGRQQVTDMLHIVRELSGMYLSRDVLTSLGSIPPPLLSLSPAPSSRGHAHCRRAHCANVISRP